MNSTTKRISVIAVIAIIALVFGLPVFAQASPNSNAAGASSAQAATGEKVKVEGVIVKREGNTVTLKTAQGADATVALTSSTQIKEKKSNFFRGAKKYDVAQLVRGLYIIAEGRKDGSGQLQAEKIQFKDDYRVVAASMENVVVPVENRVSAAEGRLSESEKNAQRLSGQIQEVSQVSNAARSAAKTAQDSADTANAGVKETAETAKNGIRVTNERISSLDDYDVKSEATVLFTVGSATLTKEAKADLDKVAEEAGRQKGYVIEITGFTSSEGGTAVNKRLSQRRADAVVQYLAENHSVPLRRIVMPMGFGELKPVADNKTRDGRKQNRRVEVKVLVSKGLGQTGE